MKQGIYQGTLLIAALSLALAACSKKDESKAAEPVKEPKTAQVMKPAPDTKPAVEPAVPEADQNADYVRILATHKEPKPTDPVIIYIRNFTVVKSDFDPSNIEGATAEIALDLLSIDSGIGKRDQHLKAADYLDVDNTPQILIKVSGVKKVGDAYEASAEVSAHGATKTLPVSFNVLKADDTSVQVEVSKEFDRNDFGISSGDDDTSASTVKIEMRITLKKG